MAIIKLTGWNFEKKETDLYVDTQGISFAARVDGLTELMQSGRNVTVKETPEEILQKIKEEERDTKI